MTIKTNKIRTFAGPKGAFGQNILIKEIYAGYHEGWLKTSDGKKIKRTFKYFPKHDIDVLLNKSKEMEEVTANFKTMSSEDKKFQELREVVWEGGFPQYHKLKEKIDYQAYPKLFDMVCSLETPIVLPEWNKELKMNVDVETNEVTITVKAGKLKEIVNGLIEEPIPTEEVKKMEDGKEVIKTYPVKGWEEDFREKLKGLTFKMKAVANGKQIGEDIKYDCYDYTFKEGKPFAKKSEPEAPAKDEWADIPFK